MVDMAAAEAAHCDDRPAWRTAGRLAVLTARLQALRATTRVDLHMASVMRNASLPLFFPLVLQ